MPWLRRYIKLPFGVPSHDTLERTFAWLDPDIFLEKFMQWTQGIVSNKIECNNTKGVVAIDGKAMRRSNEITAIPELLDILEISGYIVTIDAMGTQRKIAEKIIDKKGDYVLSLKANHAFFHDEVKYFFETQLTDMGIKVLEWSDARARISSPG